MLVMMVVVGYCDNFVFSEGFYKGGICGCPRIAIVKVTMCLGGSGGVVVVVAVIIGYYNISGDGGIVVLVMVGIAVVRFPFVKNLLIFILSGGIWGVVIDDGVKRGCCGSSLTLHHQHHHHHPLHHLHLHHLHHLYKSHNSQHNHYSTTTTNMPASLQPPHFM